MALSLQDQLKARLGTLLTLPASFFLLVPQFYFLQDFLGAHLSLILFTLGFLLYYLKMKHQKPSFRQIFVIFILCFLIFISDNLIFAQLFFPMSVVMVIECFLKKNNSFFVIVMLMLFLFVCVLGAKIEIALTHFFNITISNNVSLFRIRKIVEMDQTILLAFHVLFMNFRDNASSYFLLLFYHGVILICLMVLWINKKRNGTLFTILFFLYCVQICNLVLAILVGKLTAIPHIRYLDPLLLFPGLTVSLVVMHMVDRAHLLKLHIFSFMFVMVGFMYLCGKFSFAFNPFSSPYPEAIQCIDQLAKQFSLQEGLAEYWNVRPIRMLTKQHIKMSQLAKDLTFLNFTDNKVFFYENYQFIIVNQLPKNKLVTMIGMPKHIVYCGNHEIWLYKEINL